MSTLLRSLYAKVKSHVRPTGINTISDFFECYFGMFDSDLEFAL